MLESDLHDYVWQRIDARTRRVSIFKDRVHICKIDVDDGCRAKFWLVSLPSRQTTYIGTLFYHLGNFLNRLRLSLTSPGPWSGISLG